MSSKKIIAIVSDAVYPFNKGGKEKRIHDITTRLVSFGYQVDIYCMKWWKGSNETIIDGVKYNAICQYVPLYTGKRRSIIQALIFSISCFRLLFKKFDVIDVDHVPHMALFSTKIVCVLKRKELIVTWHEVWGKEYWQNYLGKHKGAFAAKIEKLSTAFPNKIISVSDFTTEKLKKIVRNPNIISTIPNSLDLRQINKSAIQNTHKSDIIFAGRLLKHKNVDYLIRAVPILKNKFPNITLRIIGEGPERSELETLVKSLNINNHVVFEDFIDDQKLFYGILKSARIYVLPSSREGFGISLIEAHACGLPVITVDEKDNASKFLIKVGNGMVVKLSDVEIAKAIESLIFVRKDEHFYEKFSEEYNLDHNVELVLETYGLKQAESMIAPKKVNNGSHMFKASIVVLTYNSAGTIKLVLDAVFKQKFDNFEVICIDSSSKDETVDIIKKYPAKLITIKSAHFGHGKTRNYGAQLAGGEFVVFLTHDSVPVNENWLENLIKPFSDPKVMGVYGRQIPRPDENILDKYFQSSLYGEVDKVWENDNWRQGDNIFSDANSAVRRNFILETPYVNDIIVSEDYEWAARVLKMGNKIVYTIDGSVIHSHSYNLNTLFKRNFDVGVSYLKIYTEPSLHHFVNKGIKIAFREIKFLYKSGNSKYIPQAIIRDAVRFLAIQLGKSEKYFTKKFKLNHMSSQKWYWK